jgi:type IV secretory pathway TrbF-like protein
MSNAPQNNNLTSGSHYWTRAYAGRAEVRAQNRFLKVLLLALMVVFCWTNYQWAKHAASLSQKQYVVFHDKGTETKTALASEYQSGPSETEIKATAWQFVRLVFAVSKQTVDKSHEEARRLMTANFQAEFDQTFGDDYRGNLKNTGVYRKLENVEVKQLSESETSHNGVYEVVVTGKVNSYSEASNQPVNTQNVSLIIKLVPLEERTIEHPTGLLIDGIAEHKNSTVVTSNNRQ